MKHYASILGVIFVCLGLLAVREALCQEETQPPTKRTLWSYTSEPKVSAVCSGEDFNNQEETITNSILDSITESRLKEGKLSSLLKGGSYTDFGISLIAYMAPFLLLFVICLIACPFCCCCQCGCCCQCCHYTRKMTRFQRGWPVLAFIPLALLSIIFSVLGIVYSWSLTHTYKNLECAMYLTVNEAIYGIDTSLSSGTWEGVKGIATLANNALTSLEGKKPLFGTLASSSLGPKIYTASLAAISTIANNFDSTGTVAYNVYSPLDGTQGTSFLDFRIGFNSYTSPTSQSYLMYLQMKLFEDTVYNNLGDLISTAGDAFSGTLFPVIRSAITDVESMVSDMEKMKTTIYDNVEVGESYISLIRYGFSGYLLLIALVLTLTILGVVLLACCKCARCKCLLHFGWICMLFLMLLGFLFCVILFPISIVMGELCGQIEIGNLKDVVNDLGLSGMDNVGECLYGKGDLYTKLNVSSKLSFTSTTDESFALLDDIYNYVGDSLIYNITNAYISTLDGYISTDPSQAMLSIFNSNDILSELTTQNCRGDIIRWFASGCGSTTIFSAFSDPDGVCIVISNFNRATFGGIISTRYTGSCVGSQDITTSLYNVVSYYEKMVTTINALKTSISGSFVTSLDNENINALIKARLREAYDLRNAVKGDIDSLKSSLKDGLNCTFLAKSYTRMHSSMCKYFIPTFFSVIFCMALANFFMFIAIIVLLCINRRWDSASVNAVYPFRHTKIANKDTSIN